MIHANGPGSRLVGWKAIGHFLRCTERTARRWEADRALPVHRVPGGGRSVVWAHPDELLAWLESLPSEARAELAAEWVPDSSMPSLPVTGVAPPAATVGPARASAGPVRADPAPVPNVLSAIGGTELAYSYPAANGTSFAATESLAPRAPPSHLAAAPTAGTSRWNFWGWPALLGLIVLAATVAIWKSPLVAGGPPAAEQSTPYDGNAAARALYTTARFELSTRTAGGLAAAEHDFRQLVQLEPQQAAGWSGLADTYLLLRQYGGLNDTAAYPQAAEAASKAIALDPNSADAWLDHAFVAFWWKGDSVTAFRAFDRALELAPNSAKAYHWYGTALLTHGEFAKSLEMMARARALDPDNRSIVADDGWMRFIAGQRADGLATLEHMVNVDPSFISPHTYLARAYLTLGRDAEFLREARAAADLRGKTETLARLDFAQQQFESGGRPALLDELTESEAEAVARGTGSAVIAAQYRALAHDEAGMYRWIETAETQHDHLLNTLRVDPEFAAYRAQPRFQEIIQRLP